VRNIRRDIKEAIDKLEKDKKSVRTSTSARSRRWKRFRTRDEEIEDLSAAKEKEILELK